MGLLLFAQRSWTHSMMLLASDRDESRARRSFRSESISASSPLPACRLGSFIAFESVREAVSLSERSESSNTRTDLFPKSFWESRFSCNALWTRQPKQFNGGERENDACEHMYDSRARTIERLNSVLKSK